MAHNVKILKKSWLTYNVIRLEIERPVPFNFDAGQAIELTIDDPSFKGDWAPFSLTGLNTESYLEIILRVYPQHKGMTLALSESGPGDKLIISDAWDSYNNNGPGVFIAGGTGVTPFLSILRHLHKEGMIGNSMLLFSNKTEKDVFLDDEFRQLLGNNYYNIITNQKDSKNYRGRIDGDFLKEKIQKKDQPVYICGPGDFAVHMKKYLTGLGIAEELVSVSY